MSNIARISLNFPYERLRQRQIRVAFLLSLLIHASVLLFFNVRLSPYPPQQRIIDVYFNPSKPGAPPRPKIHQAPQRLLTRPVEFNAEKPTQPIIDTATQEAPVTSEVPVVTSPATMPQTEKIERISNLTRIPSPLKKIEAAYPASERRAGIQAYVLAEVIIDTHGMVQEVHILKSGGNAFDTTVIDTLKKTAFTPGYIGEKAVPVRIAIPFRFNLN